MADTLTVRVYNVRFGDAILVTVPDRDPATGEVTTRRILIDVGNAPLVASAEGGDDSVFKPVMDDILGQLHGEPLDLYVMTHEHLDHVQGIPHAAWKVYPVDFSTRFKVQHVWLTASAAPDYAQRFPNAQRKKLEFGDMYAKIRTRLEAAPIQGMEQFGRLLVNNDPTKTSQCVTYLRTLNPHATTYVHRGVDLGGAHPFREAKLEVWAPEEDTTEYYGRLERLEATSPDLAGAQLVWSVLQIPPPGVDVGAFHQLVEARKNGVAENLLAIDRAANNTSVVFLLRWRGWKLLFAGDAELKSWRMMEKMGVLEQVHFVKVAHHGSHNGTPDGALFDAILAPRAVDRRKRSAAISTWRDTYPGIPHLATNKRLAARAELFTTLQEREKLYYELEFPG